MSVRSPLGILIGASALLASALIPVLTPVPAVAQLDSNAFGALEARAIGPARMSGRISSIDAVASQPIQVWVGTASGGVWKSTDGGITFSAVFDEHTQSAGVVRIDPTDPDTVWVGTGEPWVRNSVSYGDGVYKTTDGGETWQHVGLAASERIGAIRIHPENGDVVWVCSLGPLWSAGGERGVYKTTDGGETWNLVLEVDEDTGCADLDVDPQVPDVVYAAMWQFRRSAHFFTSGGPGSGLYRSVDGGETWTQLADGLPEGDLGRIAVAVAPSRPSTVYATVESETTALYRSDDMGSTWKQMNSSQNVQMRPFYFSELVVDPRDHMRVYKPGFILTSSIDGGKSFSSLFGGGFTGTVHPDHHALWIHPENPEQLILGTDGGVYVSENRASSWRHVKGLPVSQFYHVAYDLEWPYNVYGGLQDNGSWKGPSRAAGGITNANWKSIGFGDGFWAFPHPEDPNTIFAEFQGGQLLRVDDTTGAVKRISPAKDSGDEKLRFNWNTPLVLSPNDPKTLYVGSQYVHRSMDRGETWEIISPDLTTDDPAKQRQSESGGITVDNTTAENHTTIYSIAESPKNAELIWAGTDDGNLQISRDGGATWTNVASNAWAADPAVPEGTWVSWVHPSDHDEATAFVTFDGHWSGDMATHVYRTTDYGQTWTSLGAETLDGWAHCVVQDSVNPNLLFLGTERGLYISLDGGASWARYEAGVPPVAVHEIRIHPREHDLILGTHGRGVYILDDITALRDLTLEKIEQNVVLLPSRPAPQVVTNQLQDFGADDEFVGRNPPEAAWVTYYLKKRHLFGDLKLEIYDQAGEKITEIPGGKRVGLNRVVWPMRLDPPKLPKASNLVPAFLGPRVPEGKYKVKLIKGKETLEGEVELVPDPRLPYPEADRKLQQEVSLALYHSLTDLTFIVQSLEHVTREATARAESEQAKKADQKAFEALADKADGERKQLVSTADGGIFAGEEKLREDLGNLYAEVSGYDGRPTNSQLAAKEGLLAQLREAEGRVQAFLDAELPAINQKLERRGLDPIELLDRATWEDGAPAGSSATMLMTTKRGREVMLGYMGLFRSLTF
ncbi:MAG: glycosyl hydrolase [Thermoanaerobaculia bacterium]|nr:glycosyl hydrolase [Thermoanaerobaculia bacterium]